LFVFEPFRSELLLLAPLLAPPGLVALPWLAPGAAWLVLVALGVLIELLGALLEELVPLLGCSPVEVPPPWSWLHAVSAKAAPSITIAFFIFSPLFRFPQLHLTVDCQHRRANAVKPCFRVRRKP
jgi:hypothetical protein